MGLADKLQVARFLIQLLRPGDVIGPEARAHESCVVGGARYELYLPRGRARGVAVAVHGGDRQGWHNARLVRFARALASCEVACAVPEIPGLARCTFDPSDLEALAEVCADASRRLAGRPGLVGFSYGGGYALAVAAQAELSLRFVVAVGAFHSLPDLFDWYVQQDQVAPRTREEWDDAIYLKLVLAFWFAEPLGVSAALRGDLESLLDRYCEEASDAEKRAFFERHLRHLDVFPVAARTIDRGLLSRLSPAGKMGGVRCPVTLIHDRHDSIVPLRDAERLYAELALGGRAHHRLAITEVLSHVTPTRVLDLRGLARLASALEPLLAQG
jgi:pimeloyl-ACP methyl ester carboxylesterase